MVQREEGQTNVSIRQRSGQSFEHESSNFVRRDAKLRHEEMPFCRVAFPGPVVVRIGIVGVERGALEGDDLYDRKHEHMVGKWIIVHICV